MATIGCQATQKMNLQNLMLGGCVWGVCVILCGECVRLRASFAWSLYSLCMYVCVCRTNMPLLSLMKGQPGESTLRGPRSIFGLAKRINLPHALPDFSTVSAACESGINIFQAVCNSKLSTHAHEIGPKKTVINWALAWHSPPTPTPNSYPVF